MNIEQLQLHDFCSETQSHHRIARLLESYNGAISETTMSYIIDGGTEDTFLFQ